jgi:hypothetical protein
MALPDANNASKGNIVLFRVYSNTGKESDIKGLTPEIKYYENLLSNTCTFSAVVADTGGLDPTNKTPMPGILDGLPIRGGEKVDLVIEDSFKNKLSFIGEKSFYVNRIKSANPGTQKDVFVLDFCSLDFLKNEQTRIVKRYDVKISEAVKKILTDPSPLGLGTKKPLVIDETGVPYNFIGNQWKPFHVCTWLASRSAPVKGIGNSAGYFFYETYDGFQFRAIDSLMAQEPTKKYIYTNSTQTKPGFEAIQNMYIEKDMDLQQKLNLGTYANRTLYFDAFAFEYVSRSYDISEQQGDLSLAGSNLDYVAEQFRQTPTRFMTRILDNGWLPVGNNAKQQLIKWKSQPKQPIFDSPKLMSQTIMRYNQLYSVKTNITIRGDLSLRAGQTIYCEFPDLQDSISRLPNSQTSGKYMIASLCHRITPKDCLTSLTLVRDSYQN